MSDCSCGRMKAIIELDDVPEFQNGEIVRVYFPDSMVKSGECKPASGWISVKDMIPEMYKAVLGYAPYHHNIWAVTMHENGEWYIWSPQSKRYDPDWEGPITHWTEMPEPPKEVTGDE